MNKKLPVSVLVTGLFAVPGVGALPTRADAAQTPIIELQEAASTGFPAEMPAEISRRFKRWMRGERPDVGGMQILQDQVMRGIQSHLADARANLSGWFMAPPERAGEVLALPWSGSFPEFDARDVPAAVATEKVTFLGVATEQVSPALGAQLNLPPGTGLVVMLVSPDSPAAKAGVALNDVLQKIDDQLLVNAAQFQTLVRDKKPGDAVTLTLVRGGKTVTLQVTLGEKEISAIGDSAIPEAPQAMVPPAADGHPARPSTDSVSIQRDDGAYEISLSIDGGKRHLLVKELITGKTLYDGPADSPDDWKTLPDDVQKRIDAVIEKVNTLRKAD